MVWVAWGVGAFCGLAWFYVVWVAWVLVWAAGVGFWMLVVGFDLWVLGIDCDFAVLGGLV